MATVTGHGGGRTWRGEGAETSPPCSALEVKGEAGTGWGLGGPGMWPETMTALGLTQPTSLLTLALCNGAC